MKMKFMTVVIAALGMHSAFALTPVATQTAQDAGRVVYSSGASALRASYAGALQQALCTVGSFNEFRNSVDAGNIRAFSCTLNLAGHPWNGKDIVLHYNSVGGALTSVLGMDSDFMPKYIPNFGANCTLAAGIYTCTGTTIAKTSVGGPSDVEAELFVDVLGTTAGLDAQFADLSGVERTSVKAIQAFGIAVSGSLYDALQVAQGLGACTPKYDEACQPSISKSQYASVVAQANAGFITNFSILGVPTSEKAYICRRVPTSGTQAASNAFFLGKNCSSGGIEPSTEADSSSGYQVIEGPGTGDVINCLNGAGTSGGPGNTPAESLVAGRNFRFGVVSAENDPTAAANTWKFVKVDGAAVSQVNNQACAAATPECNRQNVIQQKYDFAFEFKLHTSVANAGNGTNLIKAIGEKLGDPTVTNLRGIAIAPDVFAGIDNATFPTLVAKATRGGNSCSPFITSF